MPVPVFHVAAMHVDNTIPGIDYIIRSDVFILHGYHDGCRLEG